MGLKSWVLLVPFILVFGSCASFQKGQDEGDGARLTAWLNTGDSQSLTKASAGVFLLDQEVLTVPGDMEAFWKSLPPQAAGGYVFEDSQPAQGSDGVFSPLMEVKTFFKKYLDKDARLITIKNPQGKRLTFLVKSGLFSFTLYGMKGPY